MWGRIEPLLPKVERRMRVWDRVHQVLLAELYAAGHLGWSRAVIGSSHVRALKGGPKPGRARSTVRGRA